jgi:hypothetical protein
MAKITDVKGLIAAIFERLESNKSAISTGAMDCDVFIGDTRECYPNLEASFPFAIIGDPPEDYMIKAGNTGTNTIDVPICLYNQYMDEGDVAQGRFGQNGLPEMAKNIIDLLWEYRFDSDSEVYFALPLKVEAAEGWEIPTGTEEEPTITTIYRKRLIMRYKIDF